ncbi:MAG: hypothetical protein JO130_18725 [Solirubrobacterales bacterium]|nr:hypothetical protein [Solirubrobacterales bacterium]
MIADASAVAFLVALVMIAGGLAAAPAQRDGTRSVKGPGISVAILALVVAGVVLSVHALL